MVYDVWVTETYCALVRVEADDSFAARDKVDDALINIDPVNEMRFVGRSISFMRRDDRVDIDLTRKEAEDGDDDKAS